MDGKNVSAVPAGPADRLTRRRHSGPVGRWLRIERPPRPELAGVVRSLYGYRQRLAAPALHRTVPFPGLPLVITFGPSHDIIDPESRTRTQRVPSFLAGVHDAFGLVGFEAFHGVQANLTPLGAFRLLGRPLAALTGRVVELDRLLGPVAERLVDRLAGTATWAGRLDLLEGFLLGRIGAGPRPAEEIAGAWQLLAATQGGMPIGRVAEAVGWSRQHLTRRFTRQVGLGPKRTARLLRFDHATELLEADDGPDLPAVAEAAGYSDQAHFSNEIREFCGLTPTELLARRQPAGGVVEPMRGG